MSRTTRNHTKCLSLFEKDPRITRATPADVFATWRKLWGNRTPEDVARYTTHLPGEQYDQTQLTDEEITEMEN